jgi:hypothetical protein
MRIPLSKVFSNNKTTRFTGTISTDGVTACVHFRVRKNDEDIAALETRREERDRKMTEKQEYDKLREADPRGPGAGAGACATGGPGTGAAGSPGYLVCSLKVYAYNFPFSVELRYYIIWQVH